MSKPDKSTQCVATSEATDSVTAAQLPRERKHFRALIVGNPNYFGNLIESPFAPVLAIKGNTTYEEIKCVGFHPQANRLDAVVFTKQPSGYSGEICGAGSAEYVRFYLSFDNGASWVDQGVTSFTAHDLPVEVTGGKRLEYAVSIPCSPPRRWCKFSNTLLARAILSWNELPPPNTPGYAPVWGNVHDTHIQVDPSTLLKLFDVFKLADFKLNAALAEAIDLDQPIAPAPSKALGLSELSVLYKDKGVEPHRFAMTAIKELIKSPELTASVSPLHASSALQLNFKLADAIEKMLATDGSTIYEELDCVGLRSSGFHDELIGVLRIKRASGYSGGPCTQGSREYVTFWGDFDNDGKFETCLGTASVQVFDLDVPAEGLEYSVHLPVDLNPYRRPCHAGPRVVPIRATLSWNHVLECSDPDAVPTWGNREETLILIPPGDPVTPGQYNPFLYDISGAAVCAIGQSNGLAFGVRPFGGSLCITGEIPSALSLTTPDTLEYRVWATQGSSMLPVVAPFSIHVEEGSGPGTAVSYSIQQNANADGFFLYREHGVPAAGAWRRVSSPNRLLGVWNTLGLSGTWTIHVEARVVGSSFVYHAGQTTCLADGTVRTSVQVTLDQTPPVANVQLTGYSDATGFHPALPCGDLTKGALIQGTFDITDNMRVGSYSLKLEPSGTIAMVIDPSSTATHQFGTWTIDTNALAPCGYVVHLEAYDQTIVNCGTSWRDDATVGFCLRAPQD